MTMGAEPVCPDCHTELPPGATFCPSCGVRTGTHRIPPRHTVDGLPAALAERYTIQQELGRGGMAIVYLAHDVRHDRSVALKIMLPEIAATLGSDRFLREIQIVAKLSHPNILPLYDSGEADGLLFYVMPYVPGEALRSRLDRERQLPIWVTRRYCSIPMPRRASICRRRTSTRIARRSIPMAMARST